MEQIESLTVIKIERLIYSMAKEEDHFHHLHGMMFHSRDLEMYLCP